MKAFHVRQKHAGKTCQKVLQGVGDHESAKFAALHSEQRKRRLQITLRTLQRAQKMAAMAIPETKQSVR